MDVSDDWRLGWVDGEHFDSMTAVHDGKDSRNSLWIWRMGSACYGSYMIDGWVI